RTPLERLELPPGSYLFTLQAEGTTTVRLPLLLRRGESRSFSFELPSASKIPKGFVYIPPGPFLFGSSQETSIRTDTLKTVPLHEVMTGPYLIAEHETTFGDWLEYLKALSPADQLAEAPLLSGANKGRLSLRRVRNGWRLGMSVDSRRYDLL